MIDFSNLTEPYFIGEVGINHNGSLKIAKKLIDAAHACDWDCVKFQKRNPDVCVPEHQKNKTKETPWGTMTYLEYKHRIEFGMIEYDEIDKWCEQKPIDWTASVWDIDSLDFLLQYDVPFIKIGSACITNEELVLECAKSQKDLILSTGMSSYKEIDKAVEIFRKNSKSELIILHTNSSYPTPKEELNLRMIPTLKNRYGGIIGYSGHEIDLSPTVIAVALGAKVVERHITISHDMWGTDQKASLEVHAMDMLRKRCRDIEVMLGSSEKEITASEKSIRRKLRG